MMKSLLIVLLFAIFQFGAVEIAAPASDQDETAPAPDQRANTIDGLLNALYESVSFPPGGEPDWNLIRSLTLKNATFVQPPRGGAAPEIITTEGFIELYKNDLDQFNLRERGFYERIANFEIEEFTNTAQAFVVFEMRFDPESEKPIGRGIDFIHLVRHDDRWWIASIITENERPDKPIPDRFLEGAPGGNDDPE